MCVDTGVSCSAGEVFVLLVWNVLLRACVSKLLGKTKVDDIHNVSILAESHQEVVWLDVAVDKVLRVDELYSTYLIVWWW